MNLCQTKIAALLLASACLALSGSAQSEAAKSLLTQGSEVAPGVRLLGRITHPRLSESSGVVASRQFPGVLWTHTDGGGPKKQVLFAIGSDGRSLGEFHVADVQIADWEDIAIDDQKHLFIADTGNNDADRSQLAVHRIDEPDPKSNARVVHPTRTWRLRFPGEPFDCESLFVWQGNGYVVSKVFNDSRAQIFRFPLTDQKSPAVLELVATTKIESPVTGADISPDGKLLGLSPSLARSFIALMAMWPGQGRASRFKQNFATNTLRAARSYRRVCWPRPSPAKSIFIPPPRFDGSESAPAPFVSVTRRPRP